ncbi:MAG TPA: T9SS type A sorting domain-containing protein [Candidatus Kapabacteria bacterium]|nr:T9SS type A sorting domain-containing protein [Candidatus Kapabacteria bacterium]
MKKLIFPCVLLSITAILPVSVYAQPGGAQCNSCKSTARPYQMCYNGTIVTECLTDPYIDPKGIPLIRPMPPCWDNTNTCTFDSIGKTIYGTYDSTYDTSFSYWQDTSVYEFNPYDSLYDYVDTTVLDFEDSTINGTFLDSVFITSFNQNQLLGSGGDIEWAMNLWLSVCGDSISDSTGGSCCAHVIEDTDGRVFGGPPFDYIIYGGTTRAIYDYDSSSCTLKCDDTFIHLNLSNDMLTQGINSDLNYLPYSGSSQPNLYDLNDSLYAHTWSIRTALAHEFGHWFGFPGEKQWDTTHCQPPAPAQDLMDSVLNFKDASPVATLPAWDQCWFQLLYCCCNECPLGVNQNNGTSLLPSTLTLKTYPNPVDHSHMAIDFSTSNEGYITVEIYNLNGQKIGTAYNGFAPNDARLVLDYDATRLSSGEYECVMKEGNKQIHYSFVVTK